VSTELLITAGVVYPWRCDHMGHKNVMWYAEKSDEATWHLLSQIGITPSHLVRPAGGIWREYSDSRPRTPYDR
jgi:acyl-CoA thioester hydrolase